jgi:ribosomal protein L19
MGWGGRVRTPLTTQLRHGYVIRYTPKRSPFDKTTFN